MTEVEKRSVFSEEKNKSYMTGLYYDRWTWHKCGYVWVKQVTHVPEIRCRCPFQSKTGQVHSSVHQQEENGHNAGDGVEFPWKQHQLERKNKTKEEGEKQMEREEGKREAISIHSKKSFPSWTEQCSLLPSCDLFQHQATFQCQKSTSKIWRKQLDLHVPVCFRWKYMKH